MTQDGEIITDSGLIGVLGVSGDYVKEEAARQVVEIGRRMREYRGERPYPNLKGKTVVVVDDGIADGFHNPGSGSVGEEEGGGRSDPRRAGRTSGYDLRTLEGGRPCRLPEDAAALLRYWRILQ